MLPRVAPHLRRLVSAHALMVAYLALALASGTAVYAAATIGSPQVSDNSLQSVDLKDGAAVKGVDIFNDSVAGADVNEATLNGVSRKLVYASSATFAGPKTTLVTVAGFTFKANCSKRDDLFQLPELRLWANGPAGEFQAFMSVALNDSTDIDNANLLPGGAFFAGATDTQVAWLFAGEGYSRSAGTVWIYSGTTLLRVDLHLIVDNRNFAPRCVMYGTVTRAV